MNKLITIIFLAIIFNFILTSCDDKEEIKELYPCIYIKDKMEYLPVALYSNKEVSYNRARIEAFRNYLKAEYEKENNNNNGIIAISPYYWGDFVFDDMIEYLDNEIIAKQVSKDSIEITHSDFIFSGWRNHWGELIYEEGTLSAVKRKNGIIYWESKDTTFAGILDYNNGIKCYSSFENERTIFISDFDSLTPLQRQIFVDGISDGYFKKSCLYLVENKDGIYIPYMEILYKKQGKVANCRVNNIPLSDNQIISMIAEGDTLMLQQSRLYISKYSKTN